MNTLMGLWDCPRPWFLSDKLENLFPLHFWSWFLFTFDHGCWFHTLLPPWRVRGIGSWPLLAPRCTLEEFCIDTLTVGSTFVYIWIRPTLHWCFLKTEKFDVVFEDSLLPFEVHIGAVIIGVVPQPQPDVRIVRAHLKCWFLTKESNVMIFRPLTRTCLPWLCWECSRRKRQS